jgi:hypothetical protein
MATKKGTTRHRRRDLTPLREAITFAIRSFEGKPAPTSEIISYVVKDGKYSKDSVYKMISAMKAAGSIKKAGNGWTAHVPLLPSVAPSTTRAKAREVLDKHVKNGNASALPCQLEMSTIPEQKVVRMEIFMQPGDPRIGEVMAVMSK